MKTHMKIRKKKHEMGYNRPGTNLQNYQFNVLCPYLNKNFVQISE